MEDYNKIIESLGVRFIHAKNTKILEPFIIRNFYDVENMILILNKGQIKFGKENEVVNQGEILFIPGGKQISLTYGTGEPTKLSNDEFVNNEEKYFQSFQDDPSTISQENFSYVNFEAKVFDSVNFFSSLDIPPFVIKDNPTIAGLIKGIVSETRAVLPGKDRVIKISVDHLVVEIIRYIIKNRLFVEQLATNSTYFKDPRLIDIFAYIRENLEGDLSNKVLAGVANVSEDYVGQYFKMLTGINPQDYIEYQRMEKAVNLLRTSKKSIRDIGRDVGYKDTAYFCRRFKMMFGIPAGKMRRRESLMNI